MRALMGCEEDFNRVGKTLRMTGSKDVSLASEVNP